MQFKRTKCNCKDCPLDGQTKVWSVCDIDKPSIALIGEAPGEQEALQGRPLVGPSGSLAQQAAQRAGILWHTTHRMNVICCKIPGNDVSSVDGEMALQCCKPGFDEEMAYLKKKGIKVYGALGATAMKALGIEGSVTKQRGSVHLFGGGEVAVPTFHPSYIMRGNWGEEVTWVNDFLKLRELSLKKYQAPKEKFNLFPKVEDVKAFVRDALSANALVACDIETTSLSPFYSKILMIGLAMNGEEALVVPFTKKGGGDYWAMKDRAEVDREIRKLMAKGRMMFQNAPFDTWHLDRHGYPVANVAEDTMLAHHAVHPELPHNLGYIVSIYGKTPYWKDVVLGSEDRMIQMDDKEVRTYNARDTVVLHQIIPGLLKDLEEMGTMRTYREWSLKLIKPLRKMSDYGLLIDQKAMKGKGTKFKRECTRLEKKLREITGVPDSFNFGSGDHMRLLIHGVEPASAAKVRDELEKYEKNPKLRKDTKKYLELAGKQRVVDEVVPLYKTSARIKSGDSGKQAVDAEALLQIKRAALTRLDAIGDLMRKTEKHKEEEVEITRLLDFIECYQKYSVVEKLASTFIKFPVMPDGRVHPSFRISGTATGRLSSSDPNGQNIPGEVQDVFVSGTGRILIKADYSNIELRVLGYLSDEPVLMKAFESGENIHDVNTRMLFGIEKGHPQWSTYRRAAKVYVFGRSYGGTVGGIYNQLQTQVPEMRMSFKEFEACDRKYFERLKNYAKWCEEEIKKARETRVSTTAFGRKRILLGLPDEIERQALNTPIQGTAGEICEQAIIELDELFEKKPEWGARMVLTVHDSIIVEANEKYKMDVAKAMKKVMEKTHKLGKYTVKIPVDIGVGKTWAETDSPEGKLKVA